MFSFFVWIVLFELCFVTPTVVCSQGRDRELYFPTYSIFADRRFIKHKIQTVHVKDLDECELLCYRHDNCVSLNIKMDPDSTTGQQECELNNSTHMEHGEHLTTDNAYLYRGAKNACGNNRPCHNNAICQSGFTDKGYRCLCYAGFTGEYCDKDIDECTQKTHNCSSDAVCNNTEGSYNCTCKPGYHGDGKNCNIVASTCKEMYDRNILSRSQLVTLKVDSQLISVYCHNGDFACGDGGWTPVMKIDGTKLTFRYHSNLWSNKIDFNVPGGKTGFDHEETKLPTYWNTSFSKICLVMKVGPQINFIVINKVADSLYSLIADGQYRSTLKGRDTWKKLIGSEASLQDNCNKEGFNVVGTSDRHSKARIGILGNNQNHCGSCDSRIGFGTGGSPDHLNTCGNEAGVDPDNFVKHIKAMGYILVY